jgi:hypothetical protein
MKGEQLNGLMAYGAKYFFNIDEYIVAQFLLFLALAATTFRQQLVAEIREFQEVFIQKLKKIEDTSFYDFLAFKR